MSIGPAAGALAGERDPFTAADALQHARVRVWKQLDDPPGHPRQLDDSKR